MDRARRGDRQGRRAAVQDVRGLRPEARLGAARRPYQPFGAALDLFYCQAPEVLLEGPAGTGKSRAALEKLHFCACKYPGMRGLIVRKSRVSCTQSVLVTFEEKVVPEGHPITSGPRRAMRQSYRYANGSEIIVGGMDDPRKVMSTEYDMVYVAEATDLLEDDWEKLTGRLRNNAMPYQQLLADCNPDAPTHWLNLRCNRGQTERLHSRHEDNPTITEAYLRVLRRLTGVRRSRLYEGAWAAAEGLVYEFDPAMHVVDRFDIPVGWRRVRVIDFGYTNPFVCQWWALDGDGRLYLYREIYMTQRLVEDHAERIAALSEGERYEADIADHDAEDRATLARRGIHTQAAYKAITVGIQAVQARLQPAGDGKPRLFLLRDALVERDERLVEAKKPFSTQQEFDGYAWPKGPDGKAQKEEPVKHDDHGMDALRYAVAYADGLAGDLPFGWLRDDPAVVEAAARMATPDAERVAARAAALGIALP